MCEKICVLIFGVYVEREMRLDFIYYIYVSDALDRYIDIWMLQRAYYNEKS